MDKEIKCCPVIDPLQQIIDKLGEMDDYLCNIKHDIMDINHKLSSLSKDSLYARFQLCWERMEERDLRLSDNSARLLNMINEFKGFVAMKRAQFNKNKEQVPEASKQSEKEPTKYYFTEEELKKKICGAILIVVMKIMTTADKKPTDEESSQEFNGLQALILELFTHSEKNEMGKHSQ